MISPRLFFVACFVLAASTAEAIDLRSADVHARSYPTVQAVAFIDKTVRERSGGRLGVSPLGENDPNSENFIVRRVTSGALDMAVVNISAFTSAVPSAVVPPLPYLFRSTAHARRVLDGPIGDELLADLASQHVVALCFYDGGPRSFYSSRKPIRTPADMTGMAVRVQPAGNWMTIAQALGAKPVPKPFGQVYSSLKTDTVEAAGNNLPSCVSGRHYEVARFFSPTEHSMEPAVLVVSKTAWNKLSKPDQELLRAAARESVPYMHKIWDDNIATAHKALAAVKVQVVADVDKKAFAAALTPLYGILAPDSRLQDFIARIQADTGS